MILWQDLNFWTAVGQIGIGALVGLTIGMVVRRARRLANPPVPFPKDRICPACGTPSLRRVRPSAGRRLLCFFTRRWPYACQRCEWPAVRPPAARPPRPAGRGTATAAAGKILEIPAKIATPAKPAPRDDIAQVKDAVFRYLALINAGDVAARAACHVSDFTTFAADGTPLTSNVIDWRTPRIYTGQSYDLRCRDLRVHVHKDTAIATGYLVGTIADATGAPIRVSGRSSWVHVRQGGEWKIAHSHVSPLCSESEADDQMRGFGGT